MSQVDGSITLGVELDDSTIDSQATKIGEKIQRQIEKSLQNSDLLKFVKVPKLEKGAGGKQGDIYGKEFIDAFSKILSSGNLKAAKSFQGAYVKVLATEGEKAARDFTVNFERILTSRGSGVAVQFSKSLSASIEVGATDSANRYAKQFEKGFSAIAPKVASNFSKDFQRVIENSDPGTARLFAKVFEEVNKTSTQAAERFSDNFRKILDNRGGKVASEYARGFNLAFVKQGALSAESYSNAFRERLRREAFTAKVEIKTPEADFNSVLAGSNASTAKLFSNIYKDIGQSSRSAATEFSRSFQAVLSGTSPQIASEFARGFQLAFKEGGNGAADAYMSSFMKRIQISLNEAQNQIKTKLEKPTVPPSFKDSFSNVLANSGSVSTAKLFSGVYKEINEVSSEAAERFSKNFERILAQNGPKAAKEYAGGFQASFREGGLNLASNFSKNFNRILKERAVQAAADVKTTLENPEIPQGFVNAFSRILRKSGSSTARQFSATWNQIYQASGEDAANEFQKNFQVVLKRRGAGKAEEYAKRISTAYEKAGKKAGREFISKFRDVMKRDFKGVTKFMRDTLVSALGNALSTGLFTVFNGVMNMVQNTIGGIIGFIRDSIGKSVQFEREITTLQAISNASPGEISNIKGAILETSQNTVTKPGDLAGIATELSKAGVPLREINAEILKSISLMSQLTGEGAQRTTEIVNQIQSQFNIPLERTTDTIDYLVAAANGAQTSISDLGLGISYAAANAKTLGVSFQSTVKMLALMSNAGLEASRGGTALSNMLKDLGENAKLLEQVGVKVFDEFGKIREPLDIVKDLRTVIQDLSKEDQYKFLSEIFDERGIRGVTALISGLEEGNVKTKQLFDQLGEYKGSLSKAGDTVNSAIGSKFDILVNKVDVLRIRFGEAFEPGLNALVDFGSRTTDYLLQNTTLFDSLNQANKEFGSFLAEHPEYAKLLADTIGELATQLFQELLNGARSLLDYLKKNPQAVKELISGFKGFLQGIGEGVKKAAELVGLLYKGAEALKLINNTPKNPQQNPSGKEYFASGLFTGPKGNIGAGDSYHIDTKFKKDLPFDRVIAAMDSMAFAYEEQGRKIEFSNAGVAGQVYDPNDPNRGDLIKRAFAAHSHSKSKNYNSLDYYIPLKNDPKGRYGSSAEGAEIMLPSFDGGKTEFGTGGNYGNYALIYDGSGNLIMKTGHGDNRKALPPNRDYDAIAKDPSLAAVQGTQVYGNNNPRLAITDGSGNMSYATTGKAYTPMNVSPNRLPAGLTSQGKTLANKYLDNPRIRAFFDAVSAAEGTNRGSKGGYNIMYGGAERLNMSGNHPFYGKELTPYGGSSASGRYQAMGHVWAEEAQKLGLKKMDPISQDIFALGRLKYRERTMSPGLLDTIANKDPSQFSKKDWNALRYEWASLTPDGLGGAYKGQGTGAGSSSKFIENYRKSLAKTPSSPDKYSGMRTRGLSPRPTSDKQSVNDLLGLVGNKPTELDKLRTKRDKEIAKMLAQQEKIAKKEREEAQKNEKETLQAKRKTAREARNLEKRTLQTNIEKNAVQFEGTPFQDAYAVNAKKLLKSFDLDTEIQDAKIALEDIDIKLKEIEENRSGEKGIKSVVEAYKAQKKALTENIEEVKKLQKQELASIDTQFQAQLAVEKRKQAEEEARKVIERRLKLQELEKKNKLSSVQDGDIKSVLENSYKLSSLELEKQVKTLPIQQEIEKLEENLRLAKESGLDFGTSTEILQSRLDSLKADLQAVNQEFKLTGDAVTEASQKILKAKIDDFGKAAFDSRSKSLNAFGNEGLDAELKKRKALADENERFRQTMSDISTLKQSNPEEYSRLFELNKRINVGNTESILNEKGGYEDRIFDAKVKNLSGRGQRFKVAEMQQQKAYMEEGRRFAQEMKVLGELQGKIPDAELQTMIAAAKELNNLNLENISSEFDTLGNTLKQIGIDVGSKFAKNLITDFDNIGDHFNTLIDDMLSRLLDLAIQQAVMGIFNPGGNKSNNGNSNSGGGFLGPLLGSIIPAFSTGGMTHSSGVTGVDNVFAMLAPNEAILSAEKVRQLSNIKPKVDLSTVKDGFSDVGSNVAQNNITTIVNIDANGSTQVTTEGTGNELGKNIEQAVTAVVTRMKFTPGGLLNGD